MAAIPNPYVKMEKYIGRDGELIGLHPPTYSRYTKTKLGGQNFCRFIISLCIFLFLLILNIMLIFFYLFTASNSEVPSYTVQNLELKSFDSTPHNNLTSHTQFLVTVKADNPNSNIGFILSGNDSAVNVVYNGTDVCSGKLPHFNQGPMNVTVMRVELVGKTEFGSGLQAAASRNDSEIPLLVKVKVPVRIVAGEYPLREFTAFVNCTLVVDNLAPNTKINIVSSNTTIGYEFR